MISIPLPQPAELHIPVISIRIAERELVSGLRNRCENKFKYLYQMYAPALMGIISRIVKTEEIAEDVLQETFVKIWSSIDSYDNSRGRLFTWMAATARNTAIDQLRSKAQLNSEKNAAIDDLSLESENYQAEINPDVIGVKQLTLNLQSSEREVLNLVYFQGYSHSEVAEKLNIPTGTVKTRLRRAIVCLRLYF
jgi:RNA polymerase sigma factor (sigma-70 family)